MTPPDIVAVVDVANWSLGGVSIIAAVIAIVLAIRHIRELRQVRANILRARDQTEELRTQMLDALDLHEAIVADDDLERCVQHLSTEYARILAGDDQLQHRLARRDLERVTQLVRMAAEGHIIIGADSFSHAETLASILLDAADTEGDEVWASSLVLPDFWERAAAYLRQQEEAIADRGIAIHRVFVFATDDEYSDKDARRHMQLQIKAGIKVSHVIAPQMTPRDVLVVRKRKSDDSSNQTELTSLPRRPLHELYAMECNVGNDKRIDRIDLWSANELQAEMVKRAWWGLQGTFAVATDTQRDKQASSDGEIVVSSRTGGPVR